MKKIILVVIALAAISTCYAKKPAVVEKPKKAYTFTDIITIAATPVKNQASSGTCWSFSGLGFLESELLKNGKAEQDLSDMWIVRNAYFDKAVKYARMHGEINLGGGGSALDVIDMIDKYGIVPEEVYRGLNYGTQKHIHSEIDKVIKAYMDAVIANRSLTTAWQAGLNGILDAYFGVMPTEFTYNGKSYTPKSFAAELELKGSDYQSFTSFTHHPFGAPFAIEVQDNWAWAPSMNVPLDELISIIDKALANGSTVLWAADVSESGFQYNKGFAVLPVLKIDDMKGSEKAKWSALNEKELSKQILKFEEAVEEIEVSQESRQLWFDNYQTTDDHGMVIVGTATDQNGKKFYKVKNSWGPDNIYKGYFYVSEPFIKGKTMNIVVARAACSTTQCFVKK